MRIGIIGAAGGQGQKFLKLDVECGVSYVVYDHHGETGKITDANCHQITKCIEDLLSCQGIIIASPNESHMKYIQYLISVNYSGYIYCEKPPVSSSRELIQLENIEDSFKKRILFGFNLERSLYKKIIDGEYHIGRLCYCNITSGHGLGFKSFYKESWRNDMNKCKNGIFEMVSIHYLEMFIAKYGLPKEEMSFGCVKAPDGKNMDNNLYSAIFGDEEIFLSLYVSYTTPLIEKSDFIFDNGYISITEDKTVIYGPRDCFDKDGMFKYPNIMEEIPIGTKQIWEESLRENLRYFLRKITNKQNIPIEEYESAIRVNKYILNMQMK